MFPMALGKYCKMRKFGHRLLAFLLQCAIASCLMREAGAQCGGFRRTARNSSSGADRSVDDAVVDVSDLVQCWWNFKGQQSTSTRYKVNWRNAIPGLRGGVDGGTAWRVLVEYNQVVPAVSRVRGAELLRRGSARGGASVFVFEGVWTKSVLPGSRPVIHFSYQYEFGSTPKRAAPVRFTTFLKTSDIIVFSAPSAKMGNDSMKETDATLEKSAGYALGFAAGNGNQSISLTPGPVTTQPSIVKRRRTEAWIMAMCVLVGLSLGLMLMATCVHPTRCVAFWRKRRRDPSVSYAPEDEAYKDLETRTRISVEDASSRSGYDYDHCNCKYARASVVSTEVGRAKSHEKYLSNLSPAVQSLHLNTRFSLPEYVAVRKSTLSHTGDTNDGATSHLLPTVTRRALPQLKIERRTVPSATSAPDLTEQSTMDSDISRSKYGNPKRQPLPRNPALAFSRAEEITGTLNSQESAL